MKINHSQRSFYFSLSLLIQNKSNYSSTLTVQPKIPQTLSFSLKLAKNLGDISIIFSYHCRPSSREGIKSAQVVKEMCLCTSSEEFSICNSLGWHHLIFWEFLLCSCMFDIMFFMEIQLHDISWFCLTHHGRQISNRCSELLKHEHSACHKNSLSLCFLSLPLGHHQIHSCWLMILFCFFHDLFQKAQENMAEPYETTGLYQP